jgi:sialate O-acetylesterase
MNGRKAKTQADETGQWKTEIGPFAAGGPFELLVRGEGDSSRTISNVEVGEVWVASGQSNMEMQVGRAFFFGGVKNKEQDIAEANYPAIRMFTVERQVAGKPQADVKGHWEVCSPETVGHFSAVAYFFGRDLHKSLKVPVGMINSSWGGMPAQAFASRESLESEPACRELLAKFDSDIATATLDLEKFVPAFTAWKASAIEAEKSGAVVPNPPGMPRDLRSEPSRPAGLYNTMIAPLMPYAIKGAIWYQGESNAGEPVQYRTLFPAMIQGWRKAWGEGDFPFLFVQLANYGGMGTGDYAGEPNWAMLREAQLMTLSLPKTGMAVTADIGESEDIHPRNKQDVGRRLALAAEAIAYGKSVSYSGPIYESMAVEGGKIRLRFQHADGGLAVKDGEGKLSADAEVKTLEIAGADRKFVPAQAKVDGEALVVWSDAVKEPVAARYAWSNDPVGCNLINRAELPASPFRTDDWQGTAEPKH